MTGSSIKRLPRCAAWSAAAMFVVSQLGCGEPRIATYPVAGGVKFDTGEAVSLGMVEFRPVGGGPIARGKLDQFGRFTLRTFEADDGAVAGKHRVVVVQHLPPQSSAASPDEHAEHESMLVAPEFASYETSGLSAEIEPQDRNEISLTVRRLTTRP
jgi:hypothetical protein